MPTNGPPARAATRRALIEGAGQLRIACVGVVAGQVPLPGMPDQPPRTPDPLAGLSPDRRRTLRQRAQVAAGWHPLAGTRTRPDLGTCGGCAHRVLVGWHNRTYPKCDLAAITHGPGSDCRAHWPACDRFEPGDPISDDAARWTPEHANRTEAGA